MIWYVEDDSAIRDIGMYALDSAGFKNRGFEDGLSCYEALKNEKPDLIILDVMLPNMDGIELLTKIRQSMEYRDIPIILATAKGQEYDRIRGFDLGADDYIVKPFSVMEMVSRVKAILRRVEYNTKKELRYDDLRMNLDARTVYIDEKEIVLTYKEFELLQLFLTKPFYVFTREQLFNQVWKIDYMGESRTLDSHIRTLRQKLGDYGKMIETVRYYGYRWGS